MSYIWVTVIGEWNNEQEDPFQTLVNTVGGFIPVVDQVLDLRDLTAHLYYMVFEKDYKDPMRWLGLGLTAIGAIPFVGSLVKGLGKLALSSDAAKAVGKYAEPLLEQIKQINPEWADIGKLKAAIDENWEAGVAASKQAWMDLLAGVKGKVSKIPLLPSWFWGADKLKSAKLELLETISEIQNLSHTMLDEALDKIKSEIDIILKELDRIAKETLGQPKLATEGIPPRVEINRPMESRGNSRSNSNNSKDTQLDINDPEVIRKDKIAHEGWYTRKQLRRLISEAEYSSHGGKHLKAKTEEEAKNLSYKAAQYLPSINNSALEKTALIKGEIVARPNGAFWAIYKSDKYVGYDTGKATRWIRAEYSSGTYHGHPMIVERVRKYIKNAQE